METPKRALTSEVHNLQTPSALGALSPLQDRRSKTDVRCSEMGVVQRVCGVRVSASRYVLCGAWMRIDVRRRRRGAFDHCRASRDIRHLAMKTSRRHRQSCSAQRFMRSRGSLGSWRKRSHRVHRNPVRTAFSVAVSASIPSNVLRALRVLHSKHARTRTQPCLTAQNVHASAQRLVRSVRNVPKNGTRITRGSVHLLVPAGGVYRILQCIAGDWYARRTSYNRT
jgi:hypothetical protein